MVTINEVMADNRDIFQWMSDNPNTYKTFAEAFPNAVICPRCGDTWSKLSIESNPRNPDKRTCAACWDKETAINTINTNIPKQYHNASFDNYNKKFIHTGEIIYNLVCDFYYKNQSGLFIYGKTRTGKTYVGYCLYRQLKTDKKYVEFVNWDNFTADNMEYDKLTDKGRSLFDLYCNCEYLILDDLGSEMSTMGTRTIFQRLINKRFTNGKHKVLITSNYTLDEVGRFINERAASRIGLFCYYYDINSDLLIDPKETNDEATARRTD